MQKAFQYETLSGKEVISDFIEKKVKNGRDYYVLNEIIKDTIDEGLSFLQSHIVYVDPNYYKFVSEGFQDLCAQSGVYPCVLDAAIFTSFDKGGWSEENVIW